MANLDDTSTTSIEAIENEASANSARSSSDRADRELTEWGASQVGSSPPRDRQPGGGSTRRAEHRLEPYRLDAGPLGPRRAHWNSTRSRTALYAAAERNELVANDGASVLGAEPLLQAGAEPERLRA